MSCRPEHLPWGQGPTESLKCCQTVDTFAQAELCLWPQQQNLGEKAQLLYEQLPEGEQVGLQ